MDFTNFDPTLITNVDLTPQISKNNTPQPGQVESDNGPLMNENPCLVCGNKAYANYIDLSQSGACTGQSAVPIKRKLKEILKRVWDSKRDKNVLCLACYDLVDRFDTLEAQLITIRENLEDKFQKTCQKLSKGSKESAQGVNNKKRSQRVKRTFRRPKSESYDNKQNSVHASDHSELSDGEHHGGNSDSELPLDGAIEVQVNINVQQSQQQGFQGDNEPKEVDSPNVYDEHHALLARGQKIRMGKLVKTDQCSDSYLCAYCPQLWPNISLLHSHVHTFHIPEVIDVAIPAELGLGNTMNCGVEIQNCAEPPDNPKPWSCLFCDSVFRARTNLSSHFKEKHTPYKPFACVDCGESFRKGIDLNRHKLYFCPQRTITFAPKRKYRRREKSGAKKQIKSESSD